MKCLRFFVGFVGFVLFFFFSFFVFDLEEVRWGERGERAVTKKGRGIQEWLQDMSFYSAKSNSKEHECLVMLVNTECGTALTATIT